MKANVYLIYIAGQWFAQMTINPEVDREFWMEEGLAEAALRADRELGIKKDQRERSKAVELRLRGEKAEAGLLWSEAMPLGDAIRSVQLWEEAGAAWGDSGSMGDRPLALLAACIEQARREAAGAPQGRPGPQAAGDASLRARRWARAAAEAGGSSPGPARAAARAREALAAAALLAAKAMQGRALLRSEAHALLDGAAADIGGALQLAQLLSWLRLTGAVAAESGRRRQRECRCKRCGSGEAHMHRTACAACGRMCAYCSACLTMGRSRECELLVLGMPAPKLPAGSIPADCPNGSSAPRKLPPLNQRFVLSKRHNSTSTKGSSSYGQSPEQAKPR